MTSSLTGMDFSPGMLRYAIEKARHVNFSVKLMEMDAQMIHLSGFVIEENEALWGTIMLRLVLNSSKGS